MIFFLLFKNVCFKYPNAANNALQDINFTINPCETICVVGENGSGKITLSKLIFGLYDEYEGNILRNVYSTPAIFKAITAMRFLLQG